MLLSDEAIARHFGSQSGCAGRTLGSRDLPKRTPNRLRIAKVPWHTAHDYELTKLNADFLIISDNHRTWSVAQRPVPRNASFVSIEAAHNADLIILHVDQWIFSEIDKLCLFKTIASIENVPKVVINHGCNMVDGCSSADMQTLLKGYHVVCNSSTAHELWSLSNSRYIRHGMTPAEWPQTSRVKRNILMTQPFHGIHQEYRNNEAGAIYEKVSGRKIDWIGRELKFDAFDKYRNFLTGSSVYFSPSFASPNPRARTEAMLCGVIPVTTNAHGEDDYIVNGENGFCSNHIEELYQYLDWLMDRPDECLKIGERARATAQEVFHINGFLDRWRCLIKDVLGSDVNI